MSEPRQPIGTTENAVSGASAAVGISGLLRGSELAGEARITVLPPNLELHTSRRLIVLRLATLDGVEGRGNVLLLHFATGDVLELRSEEPLDDLSAAISAAALGLPELTRSLRRYGSPRAGAGRDQDAFFAPLRAALARAHARHPSEAPGFFSSDLLSAELAAQLARFAAERHPSDPPERRALEAELSECAAAANASLAALLAARRALEQAPASVRFIAWRRWSRALRDVFAAHDECWPLVHAALRLPPPLPSSGGERGWRRWIPFLGPRQAGSR